MAAGECGNTGEAVFYCTDMGQLRGGGARVCHRGAGQIRSPRGRSCSRGTCRQIVTFPFLNLSADHECAEFLFSKASSCWEPGQWECMHSWFRTFLKITLLYFWNGNSDIFLFLDENLIMMNFFGMGLCLIVLRISGPLVFLLAYMRVCSFNIPWPSMVCCYALNRCANL